MTWLMLPAVLVFVVLAIGFLAWEFYFSKRGQRAIAEQNHREGDDGPPKNF
jgi:hypothetical protein